MGCDDVSGGDIIYVDPEYVPVHKTVNIGMFNATYPVLNFALSIFDINENLTFVAIERKKYV
ncbi:MAG: hypothetical protein LBE74_02055 [Treponema sp.]|jgi:hypothetical protein|nr:hypothetical protein [Treponema sp.]